MYAALKIDTFLLSNLIWHKLLYAKTLTSGVQTVPIVAFWFILKVCVKNIDNSLCNFPKQLTINVAPQFGQ
jgi:hypothetical protein